MIDFQTSSYNGELKMPSSKSYMQRILAISALSVGETVIKNYSLCDDTNHVIDIIKNLGSEVKIEKDYIKVKSNFPLVRNNQINVGESGLATRLFAPILAIYKNQFTLLGKGSILNRTQTMLIDSLRNLGVVVESNDDYLPLKLKGPIKQHKVEIDGSISSQHLTGLLIALPMLKFDTEVIVNSLASKPYIDITLELIRKFGVEIENINYNKFKIKGGQSYRAFDIDVEGDWSNAAFHLVGGAIAGEICLSNLDILSNQGDRRIVDILINAGAIVETNDNKIRVKKSELKAFDYDATDTPDLFPPLVVLALNCIGTTTLRGVKRLENKESNRAITLVEEFSKIGGKIEIIDDKMLIYGQNDLLKLNNNDIEIEVKSHNDHRIAIALAIGSLTSKYKIKLNDASAVNKSYPTFFEHFNKLKQGNLDE